MTVLMEKQEGIKKFANESPCICFNIRKAARAITQIYDNMLKDVNLTATQVSVLNSLKMLGPLTVNQLAEALATDRTTITRNLKPLQRDELVAIGAGAQDRRERVAKITAKGEERTAQALATWEKFYKRVDEKIGRERVESVCRELSETLEQIKNL